MNLLGDKNVNQPKHQKRRSGHMDQSRVILGNAEQDARRFIPSNQVSQQVSQNTPTTPTARHQSLWQRALLSPTEESVSLSSSDGVPGNFQPTPNILNAENNQWSPTYRTVIDPNFDKDLETIRKMIANNLEFPTKTGFTSEYQQMSSRHHVKQDDSRGKRFQQRISDMGQDNDYIRKTPNTKAYLCEWLTPDHPRPLRRRDLVNQEPQSGGSSKRTALSEHVSDQQKSQTGNFNLRDLMLKLVEMQEQNVKIQGQIAQHLSIEQIPQFEREPRTIDMQLDGSNEIDRENVIVNGPTTFSATKNYASKQERLITSVTQAEFQLQDDVDNYLLAVEAQNDRRMILQRQYALQEKELSMQQRRIRQKKFSQIHEKMSWIQASLEQEHQRHQLKVQKLAHIHQQLLDTPKLEINRVTDTITKEHTEEAPFRPRKLSRSMFAGSQHNLNLLKNINQEQDHQPQKQANTPPRGIQTPLQFAIPPMRLSHLQSHADSDKTASNRPSDATKGNNEQNISRSSLKGRTLAQFPLRSQSMKHVTGALKTNTSQIPIDPRPQVPSGNKPAIPELALASINKYSRYYFNKTNSGSRAKKENRPKSCMELFKIEETIPEYLSSNINLSQFDASLLSKKAITFNRRDCKVECRYELLPVSVPILELSAYFTHYLTDDVQDIKVSGNWDDRKSNTYSIDRYKKIVKVCEIMNIKPKKNVLIAKMTYLQYDRMMKSV